MGEWRNSGDVAAFKMERVWAPVNERWSRETESSFLPGL